MADDAGSTHVLEGVLMAFILLGGAWTVATLREPAGPPERPRANLEGLAGDSLVLLTGISDEHGPILSSAVAEALHCTYDEVPSPDVCLGRRGANLSFKLDSYLPPGAGYEVSVHNGVAARLVYAVGDSVGESVAASAPFVPTWNHTFVLPERSCYEAGEDVLVTMLPMVNGVAAALGALNASVGAAETVASPAHEPGWWNATLPAATRPAAGIVSVNATTRGMLLEGGSTYGSCALGGVGGAISSAIRAAALTGAASVAVHTPASFAVDLAPLLAVSGATLTQARLVIYEPLPPRQGDADSWLVAEAIDLDVSSATASATWTPPADALYGAHPLVLEATFDVAGTSIETRRAATLHVALPDGVVPLEPAYHIVLRAWMPEWR